MWKQNKHNKEFILNYFNLKHPSDVRVLSICYVIVLNAFGIGSLAAALANINKGVFDGNWSCLLYSFVAISIWGAIIAVFPNKMKFQFLLFSGIASLVITVCFITSYIVIVCVAYGLSPAIFATIGIILPLASAIFRIIYRIKVFKKEVFARRGKPLYGVIAVFSVLGLGVGKVLSPNLSERTEDILFAFLLILLACVFAALTELIYRYFLSKKYKKEFN